MLSYLVYRIYLVDIGIFRCKNIIDRFFIWLYLVFVFFCYFKFKTIWDNKIINFKAGDLQPVVHINDLRILFTHRLPAAEQFESPVFKNENSSFSYAYMAIVG